MEADLLNNINIDELTYNQCVKKYNYIKDLSDIELNDYKRINIAILRSYTLEQIEPLLAIECFKENIYPNILIGSYNQYMQEILLSTSNLYMFKPEIIILSIRLEELYPRIFDDYLNIKESIDNVIDYIINIYKDLIENIKKNLKTKIFIHNFETPINNYSSLFDFQFLNGQINIIRKINLELVELANNYSEVYIIDIENIVSVLGKKAIEDKRMMYISKNPYKIEFYKYLSKIYIKYIKAIYGFKKKCIVLDLDNTLWGGVIGEVGIENINLSDSYPGICYKAFQKELLKLNNRGILLAINSKNNFEDGIEVICKHPDMVLKESNFSDMKINWQDKATNMIEIAQKLNIGLDSMVFIDDNIVECDYIRQQLPQVTVIHLNNNSIEYVGVLNNLNLFENVSITSEDIERNKIYKKQIEREELKAKSINIEEFYISLNTTVQVKLADKMSILRISQLTQKTNQFNLTTRRYSEEEIRKISTRRDSYIYYIEVNDIYGESGIVGACIINEKDSKEWYIDTFLLSCRVMNREIEYAFMHFIYEEAIKHNVEKIIGQYIPTMKNKPVENFFSNLGFKYINSVYVYDTKSNNINCPKHIKILRNI
jgi:HAD-superfamily phosphatase, subfamily IIIC/FkbH-like domain